MVATTLRTTVVIVPYHLTGITVTLCRVSQALHLLTLRAHAHIVVVCNTRPWLVGKFCHANVAKIFGFKNTDSSAQYRTDTIATGAQLWVAAGDPDDLNLNANGIRKLNAKGSKVA